MTEDNKKLAMLTHAHETYQTHLSERWHLIYFMLLVYPAIFGGIGYLIFQLNKSDYTLVFHILLFLSFLLLLSITLFFKSLSDRLGHLIRIQRDHVIKEIEHDLDIVAKKKHDKNKDKDPGCYQPIAREGYLDNQDSPPSTTTTSITLKCFFYILFAISGVGMLISISPILCFLLGNWCYYK